MKKRLILLVCIALAAVLLTFGGITLAKYITSLSERDEDFTAATFYFRSNVMTDEETPDVLTVTASKTTVTIVNSADATTHSDTDITYTLKYYVLIDGAYTEVEAMRQEGKSLAKDTFSSETVILEPITYNGTLYKDIMLEAVSTAPYETTLRTRIKFSYAAHTVEKSYDAESGVITVKVVTNGEGGEYDFAWTSGISHDPVDPNLIFNGVSIGATSYTAELAENTTYYFSFFVTDEALRTSYASDNSLAIAAVTCVR